MKKVRPPEQNIVILTGRLTQDPELRYTPSGQAVCRFRVAVSRRFKDSEGKFQEETSYIPIVVWRDAAIRCHERLNKGSPVCIEGRLKSREWEDKDKKKQRVLEVVARRVQVLEYEVKEAEKIEGEIPEELVPEGEPPIEEVKEEIEET